MSNSKSNRRYVALTGVGNGYWVELMGATGESRSDLEERVSRQICGNQWGKAKDIQVDTMMKNLQILSVSAAHRAFPKAMRHFEEAVEWGMDE